MHLEDESVRHDGRGVELKSLISQQSVKGGGEVGEPAADGEVAAPAEALMIKDAYFRHLDRD
jgi:hypothetical protein